MRQVGAGGMGMVFEAIDQTLDRRVALKCALVGHRTSLPPEARAAREVSHYNVCKVHDLHTAVTPAGEVNFLSMEFVEGETLAARIKRDGKLAPAQALGIARQICAGLAQAHRQGVVHGDLKPANIILAQASGGGTRAVITDFGLARFAQPDGSHITSRHGGTLHYMAPEVERGGGASAASDIYALGVLFHVMLTGQPSAARRTSDPDGTTVTLGPGSVPEETPKQLAGLPRPWKQVIGKCVAPKPELRFGSAHQVGDALEPRRTALKWGAAAVVVAAAAGLGYWQRREPAPGPPIRLAVLPFTMPQSSAPDMAAVAVDIAERLSGARNSFSVITPLEARQNQADTPERARSVLGATHALRTQLTGAGNQIAAEAQLLELESGQAVRVLQAVYAPSDTATLAKALIGTVTAGLNLKPQSPQEPVADAAYPDYIKGLSILRQDPRRADEALPYLERAIERDARSALPYAALASAQIQRFRNGDGQPWLDRAAETARKASGINPDSVPVLRASGLVDQLGGRYEQAIAAFSRAAAIDPGNPAVWRVLAEAYQLAGRDEDAVKTYRKAIDAEPDSYQPYFFFGNYHLVRSQYKQAEEMFRKTATLAPGLASGHMNLGLALKQQGRYRESEQALLKALSLRPSARLLLNIGALYYDQERYAEALARFRESAKSGSPPAALLRNLGDTYRHLSRPREAASAYRAARVKSEEEVTTNPRSAAARARLALLSARLGETQRAAFELSQALAMDSGSAAVTADAVQAYEVLQQRDKAIALLQKAPRSLLEELGRAPDLTALRQDPQFRKLTAKP